MTGLSEDDAARLRELEDRAEITAVINRYGEGIRRDAPDIVASCFAADAVIDQGNGHLLQGRGEILHFYEHKQDTEAFRAASSFDQFVVSTPMTTNVTIDLDGDTAHCDSMCLVVKGGYRDGAAIMIVRGTRNVDDLVRTDEGWRIAHRTHPSIWAFEVPATLLDGSAAS